MNAGLSGRWALIAVAVLMVGASGCGSDGGPATSRDDLNSMLLQLTDLPAGWIPAPASPDTESKISPEECQRIADESPRSVAKAEVKFTSPSEGAALRHHVQQLADPSSAEQQLEIDARMAQTCPSIVSDNARLDTVKVETEQPSWMGNPLAEGDNGLWIEGTLTDLTTGATLAVKHFEVQRGPLLSALTLYGNSWAVPGDMQSKVVSLLPVITSSTAPTSTIAVVATTVESVVTSTSVNSSQPSPDAVAGLLPPGSAVSNIMSVGGTTTLVSASPATTAAGVTMLTVWTHDGVDWTPGPQIPTSAPRDDLFNESEVQLVDLTADGLPDILFGYTQSATNGHPMSQVFRRDANDWSPTVFNSIPMVESLTLGPDGTLSSVENSCVPDCATGGTITTNWVWDGLMFSGTPQGGGTTTGSSASAWGGWTYWEVPQLGTEPVRGSGCGSDGSLGAVIPDGIWDVNIESWNGTQMQVDVRCIYLGAAAQDLIDQACAADAESDDCVYWSSDWYPVNANQKLRMVPVSATVVYGVNSLGPDALTTDPASPEATWQDFDSWIVVQGGMVTAVVSPAPYG